MRGGKPPKSWSYFQLRLIGSSVRACLSSHSGWRAPQLQPGRNNFLRVKQRSTHFPRFCETCVTTCLNRYHSIYITAAWLCFDIWNIFRSKVIFYCNRDLISYQYLLEFSRFLRVAPRWVLQAPSWNLSKNVGGLPPARQWWPSGASHSKFPLIAATSPYV